MDQDDDTHPGKTCVDHEAFGSKTAELEPKRKPCQAHRGLGRKAESSCQDAPSMSGHDAIGPKKRKTGIRFPRAEYIPDGLADILASDGKKVAIQVIFFFVLAEVVNRDPTRPDSSATIVMARWISLNTLL